MTATAQKKDGAETNDSEGILVHSFKAGLNAAEDIQKRAFDIPIDILEGMGASKETVDKLRDKSQSMIGELYGAINNIADQISSAKPDTSDKD